MQVAPPGRFAIVTALNSLARVALRDGQLRRAEPLSCNPCSPGRQRVLRAPSSSGLRRVVGPPLVVMLLVAVLDSFRRDFCRFVAVHL
jgi:hypothetical protein